MIYTIIIFCHNRTAIRAYFPIMGTV